MPNPQLSENPLDQNPSPWQQEVDSFRKAGFSDSEISDEGARLHQEMMKSGFAGKEIDGYFGVKDPDMSAIKNYFETNLRVLEKEKSEEPNFSGRPNNPTGATQADSFLKAIESGFQISNAGLLLRGKAPDTLLPEDAPMFYRIASQVGTLAGDLPSMAVGSFVGGVGGTLTAPGLGTVLGAGGGSLALPAAMRQILMDHYTKGDVQDFQDFWERASSTFLTTAKNFAVGSATAGAGLGVGSALGGLASPLVRSSAAAASEVGTMVTLGKALEGQVPHPQDFIDAAVLVGGMHLAGAVPGKLRNIYAKTGLKPSEVAFEAEADPVLKQDLLSENIELPEKYKELVEKPAIQSKQENSDIQIEQAPAEATKSEAPVRSDAETKILSQIGDKEKPGIDYSFDKAYKDFVDRLDPIKKVEDRLLELRGEDKLPANESPSILARMANDYKAKTDHVMKFGTLDFKTLEKNGESFDSIIEPHKKDISGLEAYLASKRAIDIEAQGKTSGFDLDAAKEVVAKGESKFGEAQQKLVDFQNRNLEYLMESGRISEEVKNALVEMNKNYIPYHRLLDPEEGGGASGSNFLKELKGSEAKIQHPLQAVLENTQAIMRMAEKNRATSALIDLVEKTPKQAEFEKVPAAMNVVEVGEKEVQKAFDTQGIDADAKAFNVFRKQANITLAKDEFETYRDGKREIWRATNPDVAEAIKSLDGNYPAQRIELKIMSTITGIKKFGTTAMPDFALRHMMRDQLISGVQGKGNVVPFMDLYSALGDIIGEREPYQNWLKSGGANGSFIDMGDNYLKKEIFKLNDETGFMDKTWNRIKDIPAWIHAAGELGLNASRLAEFKRTVGEETSGPKIFEGGINAREVTLDFSRMGAKISAYNAIAAFMNVTIQGTDRIARAFNENPVGFLGRGAAWITTPSILLWWANHDDERYKNSPEWVKRTYWVLPIDHWTKVTDQKEMTGLPPYLIRQTKDGGYEINKGPVLRFPKPNELGLLFGTVPEMLLDRYFGDNPRALNHFREAMVHTLIPNLMPDVATPFVEQLANRSFFHGQPIVPYSAERILPAYQYTDYTSETAKALGKLIDYVPGLRDVGPQDAKLSSPLVIDNYLKSWTGTLGVYGVQLADKLLTSTGIARVKAKPSLVLSDIPFIRSFVVRDPSAQAQTIQDFRERYDQSSKVVNTIRMLGRQGNIDEMGHVMSQHNDEIIKLDGIKEAISNMGQATQRVYQSDIPGSEKRQLLDGLYYQMIEVSKAGNKLLDQLDTALHDARKQSTARKEASGIK